MTEYTPTTGEVMTAVVTYRAIGGSGVQPPLMTAIATSEETAQYVAEWMRWLAQVKAEAQVEALREVADLFQNVTESDTPVFSPATADYLHSRADRIAREAGIATEGNKTGEKQ